MFFLEAGYGQEKCASALRIKHSQGHPQTHKPLGCNSHYIFMAVTLISKIIQQHQDLPQIGSTPDSQLINQLSHLDHFVDASRWSCTDLVKFSLRHIEFSPWCPIVFELLAELLGVSALNGSIASPNLEMRICKLDHH